MEYRRFQQQVRQVNQPKTVFTSVSEAMKNINLAPGDQRGIHQSAAIVSLIAFLLIIPALQSNAQITNLVARNTSLQVDLGGPNAGLSDWMVNGVNQLNQQWFYYSVGGSPVY